MHPLMDLEEDNPLYPIHRWKHCWVHGSVHLNQVHLRQQETWLSTSSLDSCFGTTSLEEGTLLALYQDMLTGPYTELLSNGLGPAPIYDPHHNDHVLHVPRI